MTKKEIEEVISNCPANSPLEHVIELQKKCGLTLEEANKEVLDYLGFNQKTKTQEQKCYKCQKLRPFTQRTCECGEILVENLPNATGLYKAMSNVK